MVVKVKLDGLKVYQSRGGWYVYRRSTGDALIKGFKGTREELDKRLAEPDFIQTYNRPRLLSRLASDFPVETLGGFIYWYTNGDIDRPIREWTDNPRAIDNCYPKWSRLARSTR